MAAHRLLLAAAFWGAALGLAAQPNLPTVVVGTVGAGFPPSQVAQAILTEAYAQIGYRAEFQAFPPLRMITEFDLGRVDALIVAEAVFVQDHPGAVLVPTPVWNDELVAFSLRPLPIQTWSDLRPYRTGYIKGMLILEKNLSGGRKLEPVSATEPLFLMLKGDRTDVVVTSSVIGRLMVRQLGLSGVSVVSPPLAVVPNYHILTAKNAGLKAPLDAALARMVQSGRMAEITKATLAPLLALPDGKDF